MALDGNFIRALGDELQALTRGKINKIQQINDSTLLFKVRANRKNHQLLISAHPMYARVHITEAKYEAPFDPPTFLRVLRKHIDGGIITDIRQVGNDRILEFHINARNELQDEVNRILIVELMGRHANIVLTDEQYKILDGIKHLTPNNNARTIMPGVQYELPPTDKKLNPWTDALNSLLKHIDFNAGKIDKQIVGNVEGFSPLFVRELSKRAGHFTSKNLVPTIQEVLSETEVTPVLYETGNKTIFYYRKLEHLGAQFIRFDNLSALLDDYFTTRYRQALVKQQAQDYYQVVEREYERVIRKQENLSRDLKVTEDKDTYQKYGELLTAFMHEVKPHASEVVVTDYYTNAPLTIPLDARLTASDNAQKYYKLYNKLKKREVALVEQIKRAKHEREYFENVLHQMTSITTDSEVQEIREELITEGIIRKRASTKKKSSGRAKITLNEFRTRGGATVLIGKNNTQNDYLTNKKAAKEHVWFHTKDIPGSHVVITRRLSEISEEDILDAAMIAAFHSKAGESESVPVDFTEIKHVSKISGAKPGFVTYREQKTVYVTPDKRQVEAMRVSD